MGGRGSGSYSRYNAKPTTDSYLKIDLRELRKCGWLDSNLSHTLTWSRNDYVLGKISYVPSSDSITLLYQYDANGNEPESINDEIQLIKTPCNFGGERTWFCCPTCMNKVLVLFGGKYFRCRSCKGAIHPSVNESKLDRSRRALAKYQSILAPDLKLCSADGTRGLHKPKGMRYKTYFDIKKRASEKEDEMNRYFLAVIQKFI